MDNLFIPLWLKIGLIVFVLLVAIWQVPRIRVRLSGNYSGNQTGSKENSSLKHWGRLIFGLVLFVIIGSLADAFLWTQKTHEMAGAKYSIGEEKRDQKHEQTLPLSYALNKPLWQLGFSALPTLINIPIGEFNMGSPNAQSVRKVTISTTFSMSQHEITFEQYDYFIWRMKQAGIKKFIDDHETEYLYPYDQAWGRSNRPVIYVSWNDALSYSNWLSKQVNQQCRLPSEAEWEYAAKSGTKTNYFWGDEVGKNKANCMRCGSEWDNKQSAPTGSFEPNKFGLHDMHGNVWEWVQDPWHNDYKDAPDSSAPWEVDGDMNRRVLRGGSWSVPPNGLHSTYRLDYGPDSRLSSFGFRIVCHSH